MTMQELVLKNRSYRRFDETFEIPEETVKTLVSLCRTVPSTANSQAIRFLPVLSQTGRNALFPHLGWAAALPDWPGPEEGERPTAYVLLLCDKSIAAAKPIDMGICGQTLLLGATELGLGGCMLMNIRKEAIEKAIGIDTEQYDLGMVIALGKPRETVVLTDLPEDGDVRYYRDNAGVHYVPKRTLSQIMLESK